MNLDFNVMVFLIGFVFALPIIGFLFRFSIPISLFFFIAGTFLIAIFLTVDGIVLEYFSPETTTGETVHYPMTGFGDATTALNNVNKGEIEYLSSPTSILVGDKIQCMDVVLRKSGTPSTATSVIAGLFDVNNTELFRFGAMSPASVSTVFTIYTFCVDEGEEITLASGDRIGLQYTSGTATDRLEVRENTQNPFDGTVTFRQIYTTSWQSSSTTDFVMKLYDLEPQSQQEVMDFSFTGENYQLKVIMIFVAVMFMVGGALTEVRKR